MNNYGVINSVSDFAGMDVIADRWRDLALRQSGNRPFSGPGFSIAALRAYHEDAGPQLISVELGGSLAGILPIIRRPITKLGIQIDEIGSPHNPNVILNDPLLPSDGADRDAAIRLLLRALLSAGSDTVLLEHLPTNGGLAQRILELARDLGYDSDGLEPSRSLQFIYVTGTYEDYLATRSGDHRRQLKKVVRRAKEVGYEIEHHSDRASIRDMMTEWFAVESRSWQAASPASAMTDKDRSFMALLLAHLDDDEVGDLWILRMTGRPVAALRMLGGSARTCVHTMHFDQNYRQFTPGTILLDAMLASAWQRGLSEVDLHGSSSYFKRWATCARDHVSMRLYKPGLYGRLLRSSRSTLRRMRAINERSRSVQETAS